MFTTRTDSLTQEPLPDEDDLYLLYTQIKDEPGHYVQMIARSLAHSKGAYKKFLELLFYEDLIDLFESSIEEVPLRMNSDRKHVRIVSRWRLSVGR